MEKNIKSKSWYKKWWVWLIVVIVLIGIGGATGSKDADKLKTTNSNQSATSQSQSAPAPEKPKWDAAAVYEKIQTGMTKAQVEAAVGQPSKNCSESAIDGYGTTEFCTYSGGFGDKGSISVSYSNGTVQSKSKIDF